MASQLMRLDGRSSKKSSPLPAARKPKAKTTESGKKSLFPGWSGRRSKTSSKFQVSSSKFQVPSSKFKHWLLSFFPSSKAGHTDDPLIRKNFVVFVSKGEADAGKE